MGPLAVAVPLEPPRRDGLQAPAGAEDSCRTSGNAFKEGAPCWARATRPKYLLQSYHPSATCLELRPGVTGLMRSFGIEISFLEIFFSLAQGESGGHRYTRTVVARQRLRQRQPLVFAKAR